MNITRRKAITTSLKGAMAGMGAYAFGMPISDSMRKSGDTKPLPFRVSLNTSTLMAYKLPVDQQIDLVGAAGFNGIELWVSDVNAFLEKGGSTQTLKEKLQANGLVLENMIGFTQWCSDDAEARKKANDQLQREMEMTAALGGKFIAAPIMGHKTLDPANFAEYSQRYSTILELADTTKVVPLLELWGMGALHKISDCAKIAIATGHPDAALLLDFYHIHRGGNAWQTLDLLNGKRLPVIHLNDFPANPAYDQLTDADRIFPGDGVCPFNTVLPMLYEAGFRGGLSVELFNKTYWETMDAETILKQCHAKSVAVIVKAMEHFK